MAIKLVHAVGDFSSPLGWRVSDTKRLYEKALEFLAKSPTAMSVIRFVSEHKTEVQLVCIPGGEGEMLFPGEIEGHNITTVVWDPNKHFQFYVNVAPVSNIVFADLKSYQPAIVLLHELGHAKQWLEDGSLHEQRFHRGASGIAEIEAENLALHEGPVARELGLPVRKHYQHFPNSPMLPNNKVRLLHGFTVGKDAEVTTGARNALTL